VTGAVAVLVSAYSLFSGKCGRKSELELNAEFFTTLFSFCLQGAMAVRSGIDLVVFQETFALLPATYKMFTNLQFLIIIETVLGFAAAMPIMVFLLHSKWRLLFGHKLQ
jgi:hypothetical protein